MMQKFLAPSVSNSYDAIVVHQSFSNNWLISTSPASRQRWWQASRNCLDINIYWAVTSFDGTYTFNTKTEFFMEWEDVKNDGA